MQLENQKYNQMLDNKSNQLHSRNRLLDRSNRFLHRTRKLFLSNNSNEGFASWREVDNRGIYMLASLNVLPFSTQVFKSAGIKITQNSNKFYVGKSGLYEINCGWQHTIPSNYEIDSRIESGTLYLTKNGATTLTDANVHFLDNEFIKYGCAGTTPCEEFKDLLSLHGSKHVWLNKDSDYIQICLIPYGANSLQPPDFGDGFIEISFVTDKVIEL